MNVEYKPHKNPFKIALLVEISLLIIGGIIVWIFELVGKPLYWIPVVIVAAVLIFSLLLTLSLFRYEAMRDIRADGSFKSGNLPLYTDQTSLLGHDLVDERERKEKQD